MEEKTYTIDELSDMTGYSRRTIRYYVQQGLIGAPAGRGRGGFYYDSHLQKLKEIRALRCMSDGMWKKILAGGSPKSSGWSGR